MSLRVDRLIKLLEENNLNQRELAKKIGVTEVTVSRYINDEGRSPRVEIMTKIAEVLGVSVEYLMGTSNKKHPYAEGLVEEALNNLKAKGYKVEGLTVEEIADLLEDGLKLKEMFKSK